jgi:signal transduction histidine kinase
MLKRVMRVNVGLRTRLEPTGAQVRAGQGQLEQVLMNLILNARDAMPNGGWITVTTAVDLGGDAPELHLVVEDTGIGMDEPTRQRVFEPLFTTKSPERGTGLGLATVRNIVTQLGGRVEAKSQLGRGSRFEVILPTA